MRGGRPAAIRQSMEGNETTRSLNTHWSYIGALVRGVLTSRHLRSVNAKLTCGVKHNGGFKAEAGRFAQTSGDLLCKRAAFARY